MSNGVVPAEMIREMFRVAEEASAEMRESYRALLEAQNNITTSLRVNRAADAATIRMRTYLEAGMLDEATRELDGITRWYRSMAEGADAAAKALDLVPQLPAKWPPASARVVQWDLAFEVQGQAKTLTARRIIEAPGYVEAVQELMRVQPNALNVRSIRYRIPGTDWISLARKPRTLA